MGEKKSDSLAFRVLAVIAGFAVVAVVAKHFFGDRGIDVALIVAIGAIGQLTGRARVPARRRRTAPVPVIEDHWRSDRWVQESVERGMRALDEWRVEQRDV